MKFEVVHQLVGDASFTRGHRAKILYDLVIQSDVKHILELGFARGATACYMAAALDEKGGGGKIITMDNQIAQTLTPHIHALLAKTQLEKYVVPVFAHHTYTWELMKLIEQQTVDGVCNPMFDFCFIDGAHSWEVDGLAFFLVDKLLKPGSWILFDDMYYSFTELPADSDFVRPLSDEEKRTAQIERVFALLVCQHPGYHNFSIQDAWGWAQKRLELQSGADNRADLIHNLYASQSIKSNLIAILNKFRKRAIKKEIARMNKL